MNQHAHHRPRQTAVTLAVAALAAMTQMQTATAATVSSPFVGLYMWGAGDLSVTSTISGGPMGVLSFSFSGGAVGTLTNSGLISGGYGVQNSSGMAALNNTIGGSISGTGNDGVFNASSIGTLTNDGAINGTHFGILNYYAATIGTLTNSGAITGGGTSGGSWAGIDNAGSIGTLTNTSTGTISTAGGVFGVYNTYKIDTLSNSGLITASTRGIINSGTITTLINNSGGTISHSGSGFGHGIDNSGLIGSLSNSGFIGVTGGTGGTGYGNGINNSGTITTLTNDSGGTIVGKYTGLYNSGTIGTLTNHGAIIGGYSAGVANDGSIGTLTNTGTITGSNSYSGNEGFGVNNGGTIGALTNTGTISGTVSGSGTAYGISNVGTIGSLANSGLITGSTYAVFNDAGGTLGPVTNAGVIAGNIGNLSSRDLSISGGTGTTFGTLTGYGGGSTLGTIDNPNASVAFVSGNLLLNDNINLGSGTINAVNNTGSAVVQVNQPVSITGNYNQGSGATLQIGVASGATTQGTLGTDAGYGRLVVTGNTTIAQGSSITLQSNGYAFAAGQRYVVVDTAGTATYNAGSLRYAINGYTSTVTGAAVANGSKSDLVLTVVSARSLSATTTPSPTTSSQTTTTTTTPNPASMATVPNAVASLNGLLGYTGIGSATLLNLYNATLGSLSEGSTAGANQIGKQLGATQTGWAPAAPTFDALNVVGAHVNTLRLAQAAGATGVATGDSPAQWGVWGQAFGGHAQQSERDQTDGYRANYGGLLIGADREINDRWRAGGVFSYSNTSIDNTGDTSGSFARVNGYGLIGYASYTGNPWYVNLSGAAVQQRYDTSRAVSMQGFSGTASGHFSGQQYVARTEAGYPLPVGSATLTPLASLTYSYLTQDSYTEDGGNGTALSVGATHVGSIKSGLGAKLEKGFATRYGQIVLEARAQWIHEYDHARQVTSASFAADATGQTAFTTVGMTPVSDLADISLGATLLRANNLSLSARYELQAGRGYVSQTGSVRLRQLF
ncbi:autotransporter outer membrane beta-barrel domain-containing protein [Ralstonia solanacearum]|uniref:autotransporter outer membrane beta-barrel domain-containing protein n=1 Tax=Ralstonia solanacearum TaxID=305 RepID=UPI0018D1AA95|nr:autotransporter domain-containing protein [Ralstonia solanacearum]